jgi:hypothetical protein
VLVIDHMAVEDVMNENKRLTDRIAQTYKSNNERQQKSKAVLEQVAPKAKELKAFEVLGAQQGVTAGINAAVIATVAQVANAKGQINGPTEGTGKDARPAALQAIYLRSLAVPEFAVDAASGPFRPLAADRTITMVVSIPAIAMPNEITRQLLESLKTLAVPETLASAHPGMAAYRDWLTKHPSATEDEKAHQVPRLFSEVQALSDVPGEELYWYIDKTATNDQGDLEPIEEERRIPSKVVTLACTIKGQEAAP